MKYTKNIITLIMILVFPIRIQAHPREYFVLYNAPFIFFAILLSGITKYIFLKSKYPIKIKLVKKIVFTGCLEIFCTLLALIFSGMPVLLWDGEFSYPVLIVFYLLLGGFVNQYLLSGIERKWARIKKYLLAIILAMLYLFFIIIVYGLVNFFRQ